MNLFHHDLASVIDVDAACRGRADGAGRGTVDGPRRTPHGGHHQPRGSRRDRHRAPPSDGMGEAERLRVVQPMDDGPAHLRGQARAAGASRLEQRAVADYCGFN